MSLVSEELSNIEDEEKVRTNKKNIEQTSDYMYWDWVGEGRETVVVVMYEEDCHLYK